MRRGDAERVSQDKHRHSENNQTDEQNFGEFGNQLQHDFSADKSFAGQTAEGFAESNNTGSGSLARENVCFTFAQLDQHDGVFLFSG